VHLDPSPRRGRQKPSGMSRPGPLPPPAGARLGATPRPTGLRPWLSPAARGSGLSRRRRSEPIVGVCGMAGKRTLNWILRLACVAVALGILIWGGLSLTSALQRTQFATPPPDSPAPSDPAPPRPERGTAGLPSRVRALPQPHTAGQASRATPVPPTPAGPRPPECVPVPEARDILLFCGARFGTPRGREGECPLFYQLCQGHEPLRRRGGGTCGPWRSASSAPPRASKWWGTLRSGGEAATIRSWPR